MRINKILVVDNDRVMRSFMTNHLQKKGYQTIAAKDGLAALEILSAQTPDVIFIDLVMPNINGDKVCHIIRSRPALSKCLLVMITAVAAEERPSPEKYGADIVLAKQHFETLSGNIDAILYEYEQGRGEGLKGRTIAADQVCERSITRELLDAQKHYEAILKNMSEGLVELEKGLRIVDINPAALAITGRGEEDLLSISFLDLFSKTDQQVIQARITEAKHANQEVSINRPLKLNNKPVTFKIIPVFRGLQSFILIILKDLSKRKSLEAQLMHAQKMETLGTMTSGVAHDFNNILNIITGYVELIESDTYEEQLHQKGLRRIKEASYRARDIIRQLLLFSRKEEEQKIPQELGLPIKETLKMIRSTTPVSIEILDSIAPDLPMVEADISQIYQVVVNLCKNGVDAMADNGGTLSVKLEHVTLSGQERGACLNQNLSGKSFIKLSVGDTGPGIAPEDQDRIFDPYFTTKQMDEGTGLGLSMARRIVEKHEGQIKVYSRVGEGTTFEVYFPIALKKTNDSNKKRKRRRPLPNGNESILFIDDEKTAVELNQIRLEKLGYRIKGETDPKRALDLYFTDPKQFDLIISNISMPKISGETLCREALGIRPDMKCILCSGSSPKISEDPSETNPNMEYLGKPVDIETMATTIRDLLDR